LAVVVERVPSGPDQLALRIVDARGAALALFIERLRPQGNYFKRSERLGLWYLREETGDTDVPPWTGRLVEEVAGLVLSPAFAALADELAAPRDGGRESSQPEQALAGFRQYSVFDLVRLGLKPAASLVAGSEAEAERLAAGLPAMALSRFGFVRDALDNLVYVAAGRTPPAGSAGSLQRVVYVAPSQAEADRVRDLEERLYAQHRSLFELTRAQEDLGVALGFPVCCVRAFARARHEGRRVADFHRSLTRLGWHLRPIDWRLNHVVARRYALPILVHVPCGAACKATVAQIDLLMARLYDDHEREAVEDVLSQGAVVYLDDRIALFRPLAVASDTGEVRISDFNVEARPEVVGQPPDHARSLRRDQLAPLCDAEVSGLRVRDRQLEVLAHRSWQPYAPAETSRTAAPILLVPLPRPGIGAIEGPTARLPVEGFSGPIPASARYVLMKLFKPAYDRYVLSLLSRYLPAEARAADSVLDAMCGRNLPNLVALRRFCATARCIEAVDIDIDERRRLPRGTSVRRADLLEPLSASARYDLITVFKPPTGPLASRIETVFATLAAVLAPNGYLFVVLGEDDQAEYLEEVLRQLDLSLITSEPNSVATRLEVEHKRVLVCSSRAERTTGSAKRVRR
jgi:hypothetical protein